MQPFEILRKKTDPTTASSTRTRRTTADTHRTILLGISGRIGGKGLPEIIKRLRLWQADNGKIHHVIKGSVIHSIWSNAYGNSIATTYTVDTMTFSLPRCWLIVPDRALRLQTWAILHGNEHARWCDDTFNFVWTQGERMDLLKPKISKSLGRLYVCSCFQ